MRLSQQEVRQNIQRRVAKQLQELEAEFRKGHKSYIAKLKGQTIEEYRPDLTLNKPAANVGASSFFEDEEQAQGCVDPVSARRRPHTARAKSAREHAHRAVRRRPNASAGVSRGAPLVPPALSPLPSAHASASPTRISRLPVPRSASRRSRRSSSS